MGTKTYSPKMVVATVGPCVLRGYVDGSMLKVTRDTDDFSDMVGADGEVTRIENADKRGTVTFNLASSSQANDELSALMLTGECVPMTVKDLNGTTVAFAGSAWVKKPADIEFGKEVTGREWAIRCESLEMFVGGTTRGSVLDPES